MTSVQKRRWRIRALAVILLCVNASTAFAWGAGSYCCSWTYYCSTSQPPRDMTTCSSAVYQTTFYNCLNTPSCGYYGGDLMCNFPCYD